MGARKIRHVNTVWDTKLLTEEEFQAPIAANLAQFHRYKNDLLAILQKEYDSGPKSKPFNLKKSSERLHIAAQHFLWPEVDRQRRSITPASALVKQFKSLATTLGRARRSTQKAMQFPAGKHLCAALFAEKLDFSNPLFDLRPEVDEIEVDEITFAEVNVFVKSLINEVPKVVEALANLEVVALRPVSWWSRAASPSFCRDCAFTRAIGNASSRAVRLWSSQNRLP